MGTDHSPFILPRPGARAAPPGFPPDVIPNQIITAAHINAIRDSAAIWPGNVNGNNKTLVSVAALGIGTAAPNPGAGMEVFKAGATVLHAVFGHSTAAVGIQTYNNVGAIQGYNGTATAGGADLILQPSSGRVQIGPSLGGTTGALDIYRNTGVENLLRMHYGNVYEVQLGFDTAGNIRAAYSPNSDKELAFGTGAAGRIQMYVGGILRLGIDAAGKITMGNASADAVQINGRTQFTVPDNSGIALLHAGTSVSGRLAMRSAFGLNHFVMEGWDGSAFYPGFGCCDQGHGVFISGRYTAETVIPNSTWTCQINEGGNQLYFRVKYANGTVKTGVLAIA